MVMDPAFLDGLPEGPDGDRAKEFIAGSCGAICLAVTPSAGSIAGQVTRQDGEPVAAERMIFARGISEAAMTLTVTTGTLIVASSTSVLVFKTDAAGAFALTVTATPPAVVSFCVDGGEDRVIEVVV